MLHHLNIDMQHELIKDYHTIFFCIIENLQLSQMPPGLSVSLTPHILQGYVFK
jgi:hypothetical protein